MSNYFQSAFHITQPHIQGCNIDISSSHQSLYSIGTDDIICQYTLNNQPKINTISNPNSHQLLKLAYNHKQNIFAVGTLSGHVLQLQNNFNTFTVNSSRTLYKSLIESDHSKVRALSFTQDGNFLIIGTNQSYCIIYEWKSKRFFKHKLQTQTQIASITVDYRNNFFCIIDFDGKASIYQIQEYQQPQKIEIQNNSDSQDPFAQLASPHKQKHLRLLGAYKITKPTSNILKKNYPIMASFNFTDSYLSQTLYFPGQSTLQKVQLNLPPASFNTQYQLCTNIFHSNEILQVIWLNNQHGGLLLTGTEVQLTIWYEQKGEKLMTFFLEAIFGAGQLIKSICVRRFTDNINWGFAMVGKNKNKQQSQVCKIYDFKAFQQLENQLSKQNHNVQIIQNQNQSLQIQLLQNSNRRAPQKPKPFRQQSIAAKLIISYLELSLTTSYQRRQCDNARFLFYNSVGCIIQRFGVQNESLIQLELHDRSKISRIKIPGQNFFQYFALCSDTLVYASNSKIYTQCQKYLREGFQWQYEWEQIEGIAIGGQWICGVNKGEIKVWDWVGNQLHSVSFDRRFVTMTSYEDLLVIVYHSSLPMWGAQSYKMLIFEVTSKTMKCIRDTIVPAKISVALKWFGFSEQGMLCCKDESQSLRVYMFQRDQWISTISWDPLVERLFIQHIQNYEIYGFRLDQRFPSEPRVMPRSLPRKVPFDLSNFKIQYLSPEENEYIKKHKLSLMWIQHQKFRSARWYKHKYSRTKDNRWYARTQSIKSQDQIKATQAQLDIKLLDYFKKYLKLNKNTQDHKIWRKVLMLCNSLTFYTETRNKLNEVLSQSQVRLKPRRQADIICCPLQNSQVISLKKTNISQLNRLQQMMGLSWVNLQQRNEKFEVQYN